jgi:hypothetical protein
MQDSNTHFAIQNFQWYAKKFSEKLSTIWARAFIEVRQPCTRAFVSKTSFLIQFVLKFRRHLFFVEISSTINKTNKYYSYLIVLS